MVTNSPYTEPIQRIHREIEGFFHAAFQLNSIFENNNVGPRERYGLITAETLEDTSDRPGLRNLPANASEVIIRYAILLVIGVDVAGVSEREAERLAETAFLKEALNLDHKLPQIKRTITSDYGCFKDLVLRKPVDRGISTLLKDPDTYIVRVTAAAELQLIIWKDRSGSGEHILPIGA